MSYKVRRTEYELKVRGTGQCTVVWQSPGGSCQNKKERKREKQRVDRVGESWDFNRCSDASLVAKKKRDQCQKMRFLGQRGLATRLARRFSREETVVWVKEFTGKAVFVVVELVINLHKTCVCRCKFSDKFAYLIPRDCPRVCGNLCRRQVCVKDWLFPIIYVKVHPCALRVCDLAYDFSLKQQR